MITLKIINIVYLQAMMILDPNITSVGISISQVQVHSNIGGMG